MKFENFRFSAWQPCKFDSFTFHDKYEKFFDFFQLFVMSTILQFVFFDYSSASLVGRQNVPIHLRWAAMLSTLRTTALHKKPF